MKRFVLIFILFAPVFVQGQNILNIPGNRYLSFNAQVYEQPLGLEVAYNTYKSSKSVLSFGANYYQGQAGLTDYHLGFVSFSYNYKLFDLGDIFLFYAFSDVMLGAEKLFSAVEQDKELFNFPYYGISFGSYLEISTVKHIALVVKPEYYFVSKSEVFKGFGGIKAGLNIYLQ